ncbi:DUF6114 domain-containing protein [Natrinema halophilum]|uniref:Uncharacterized protein n=1 Tax=Natrinema halophilum TaxID=1699371 RepID=A0A7D5GTB0_9EURY|nr:DUF6114 domain-containing protein [Natrinema halophilum]QLG49166.1 DUF6114 domain-containing protein [Natrinema halophilum]
MPPQDSRDDTKSPTDQCDSQSNRIAKLIEGRWNRFADWRTQRPLLGGLLLCLGGFLITWVPAQALPDFLSVSGQVTGVLALGTMLGVFAFLSGMSALYKPQYSHEIGVVGVVLSILSLFGSLGGLFFGMLFGIIGGNLCIAWKPDAAVVEDAVSEPSTVDTALARMRGTLGRIATKTRSHLRTGVEAISQRGLDE